MRLTGDLDTWLLDAAGWRWVGSRGFLAGTVVVGAFLMGVEVGLCGIEVVLIGTEVVVGILKGVAVTLARIEEGAWVYFCVTAGRWNLFGAIVVGLPLEAA